MFTQVEENYLKSLFSLSNESGEVNVNLLSQKLGIKKPSVTSMMKKLADKKLVYYTSYKPVRLTAKGRKAAGMIIRKHRLTEMFLVEKMEFGWESVHEIAEQVEHIQSEAFFAKMDEILGFPTIDPHGSPIPDKHGRVFFKTYKTLSDCNPGETVRLAALTHSSLEFLRFLNCRELKLGTSIQILSKESFDKSMRVTYDNHTSETLSFTVSEKLLVESC
jgi:DtxR family transcriptional regulator, Mn-dependent transcriptional regulator